RRQPLPDRLAAPGAGEIAACPRHLELDSSRRGGTDPPRIGLGRFRTTAHRSTRIGENGRGHGKKPVAREGIFLLATWGAGRPAAPRPSGVTTGWIALWLPWGSRSLGGNRSITSRGTPCMIRPEDFSTRLRNSLVLALFPGETISTTATI